MRYVLTWILVLVVSILFVAWMSHLAKDHCSATCGAKSYAVKGRESYCFCEEPLLDGGTGWVLHE